MRASFWSSRGSFGWRSFYRNDPRPVVPEGDLSHAYPTGGRFRKIPGFALAPGFCGADRPFPKDPIVFSRILVTLMVLPLAITAAAQEKQRIDKAADLPVFSYKLDGKLEAL